VRADLLAAACADRCTFEERVEQGGKYAPAYILIWSPPDPMPQVRCPPPACACPRRERRMGGGEKETPNDCAQL